MFPKSLLARVQTERSLELCEQWACVEFLQTHVKVRRHGSAVMNQCAGKRQSHPDHQVHKDSHWPLFLKKPYPKHTKPDEERFIEDALSQCDDHS